jgi:hypothetical protein
MVENNEFIPDRQFGFRERHSTIEQTLIQCQGHSATGRIRQKCISLHVTGRGGQ